MIIWGNRTGSDCGSSLTTETTDGSFFTAAGSFDYSTGENYCICIRSDCALSQITGSSGDSSLTDHEICCDRKGSSSSLNGSGADIASMIVHWNSSGSHLTFRSDGD